jgi:hypothetical protein
LLFTLFVSLSLLYHLFVKKSFLGCTLELQWSVNFGWKMGKRRIRERKGKERKKEEKKNTGRALICYGLDPHNTVSNSIGSDDRTTSTVSGRHTHKGKKAGQETANAQGRFITRAAKHVGRDFWKFSAKIQSTHESYKRKKRGEKKKGCPVCLG